MSTKFFIKIKGVKGSKAPSTVPGIWEVPIKYLQLTNKQARWKNGWIKQNSAFKKRDMIYMTRVMTFQEISEENPKKPIRERILINDFILEFPPSILLD